MSVRRGFLFLLLAFITLGIYYPSIFAGATSIDDVQMITGFMNIERLDLKSLFLPGTSGYYYRPLLAVTFVVDNIFWGMHESFMHLENVIFHLINVILVFLIAERVAIRYQIEGKTVPLCAAIIFAVHPINTESVNWISGRTDLLAGIFILLSILLLLKSIQTNKTFWSGAACVAFLMGCFAKEVAVCALPGLLLLIVSFDRQESFRRGVAKRWLCCLMLSSTGFIYFLFRFFAFRQGDSGLKTAAVGVNSPAFNLLDIIQVGLKVYGFYLKKIFVPWPLNFAIISIPDYYLLFGVLLLILLAGLLWRRGLLSALCITGFCVLAPALLVPLGKMAWTPVAERYLYIPSATFSIAVTVLVSSKVLRERAPLRMPIFFMTSVLLALCVSTTVNRNIIWQNNITLFQDTLRHSPNFFLAQNALAYSLLQEGKRDEAKQILLSMEAPEGSKRGGKLVDSNKASVLMAEGDLSGAKKILVRNIEESGFLYEKIVEQIISINASLIAKERDAQKRNELVVETVGYFSKLHDRTGDPFIFYRIGQFYLNVGDKKGAQAYFSKAYQGSPDGTHYKMAALKLAEKLKP